MVQDCGRKKYHFGEYTSDTGALFSLLNEQMENFGVLLKCGTIINQFCPEFFPGVSKNIANFVDAYFIPPVFVIGKDQRKKFRNDAVVVRGN
jgi:hypothetical protein